MCQLMLPWLHRSEWITNEYKQALESFEQSWSLPELVYSKSSFEKHPLPNIPDMAESSKVTVRRCGLFLQ